MVSVMHEPGSFARRLANDGPTVFGTWVKLPTLETVELLGHAGFDFIVVDMEHAPLTLESAYRAIVTAQGMGMGALVRVPDRSDSHLQRLLDAGADGILVPRVTDAATCRAAVEAMRFSPTGSRGLGSTSRAGRWGLDGTADYLERGRSGIVRGVQVEDQGGLRVIDDILAVDGLSALFIGTGDLSLSSGLPAAHADNDALIAGALAACHARSLPCGTAVGDATAARAAAERGFRFVMVSNDATIFGKAAGDLRRAIEN
jgi:2-dehydro-3-deoxyglucarate aldolase/4-hydroxy-2-oxoheptanedioate aldolase